LVIVAAVIFRAFFLKPSPPPAPKIPNSVAVISFTNLTGDKDLDDWRRGIPEGLITNLENTGYFRVTPWERMLDILRQMGKKNIETIDSDLGFELCRQAGIESLVTGIMRKAGDMLSLDVRVLDAETKELRKSAGSRGRGEESILSTQVDELSRAIAEGLGTAKEKIEKTEFQVAEMTTASPEAWRLFQIGRERLDNIDPEKAAEYFEQALKIDPNFAIAYYELSNAYSTSAKYNAVRARARKGQVKDRSIICQAGGARSCKNHGNL
jgi:TolB-like protein